MSGKWKVVRPFKLGLKTGLRHEEGMEAEKLGGWGGGGGGGGGGAAGA